MHERTSCYFSLRENWYQVRLPSRHIERDRLISYVSLHDFNENKIPLLVKMYSEMF